MLMNIIRIISISLKLIICETKLRFGMTKNISANLEFENEVFNGGATACRF